jgi:HKD family nuclease
VALRIQGAFWQEVYRSESFVAEFSGGKLQDPGFSDSLPQSARENGSVRVQLLTEESIETELLALLNTVTKGDRISIGAFYLSDREVMTALLWASRRGVEIRIILDPSKDAFGREKYGIPNQPAARELITQSQGKIRLRWYDTHGEQFHAKFSMITKQDGTAYLFLGSANLTRRNLDNYNLELNVKVTANASAPVMQEIRHYYERMWSNQDGNHYTVDYAHYENHSLVKQVLYRVLEFGGLSTF